MDIDQRVGKIKKKEVFPLFIRPDDLGVWLIKAFWWHIRQALEAKNGRDLIVGNASSEAEQACRWVRMIYTFGSGIE